MTKERRRFAWLPAQVWTLGRFYRFPVRKVWLRRVTETWCKSIDCSGPGWLAWEDRQ